MEEVRGLNVPHYEGLTVKAFLGKYEQDAAVMRYLPPEKELAKVERQWICNVSLTSH